MLIPFDSESCYTGLLCQYVPSHAVDVWLGRWFSIELFRVVFVVDIVTNSDELSTIVAACKKNDCDTEDLRRRDASEVWGIGFEYELIHSNGNGPDEKGIELLVMLRSTGCQPLLHFSRDALKSLRSSRSHVGQLPFEVFGAVSRLAFLYFGELRVKCTFLELL